MLNRKTGVALPAVAIAVTMTILVSACSGGSGQQPRTPLGGTAAAEQPIPAPTIKIAPAEGTRRVRPDRNVVVVADGGALDEVVVESAGEPVDGDFDPTRTRWTSKRPLKPSSTYTVSAKATGEGGPTTATSEFTTLKPKYELAVADVTPGIKGETVGVGMPIMVTFNQAVTNKAAVEAVLKVEAEKPVDGAWRWISDRLVIYRPAKFWPAHQKVTLTADLAGVRGGADMYGIEPFTHTIKIGARMVSQVNTRTHMMIVKKDGKVVQSMKISAGKATTREYTTTSGVHLTMSRHNPEIMISPGKKEGDPGYYKEVVNHAVRISNSGEYVHSAPWSVGSQGRANVSHGCINAHPTQAKWFYDNFQRGDVVTITGTDRPLEWNNGWGFWQMSFSKWKSGSALES
ncbi:L,D-transpeptidase [Acrocarpospora catenulata]|uniref:L,D-transpeptidase n=1 Tax=Acrocarpospora catenulata TaxID=2836182 RepID=UPI0027E15F98|nr:Ig-like domain-containing protein [Acrocarpospora catenulata]